MELLAEHRTCPLRHCAPKRVLLALPGVLIAVAAGLPTANAQTAPDPALRVVDTLPEIVVTATRREQSLVDVPISVSALTQDSMDAKGIRDISDAVRFIPGISIDNSGTNALSIRGIASSGGAGTTGIYLDDTPIQVRSLGFDPDDTLPAVFDLERIEVLRGPQGTLFGAGAEGGAVRYIFTPPSVTKASSYIRSELAFTGSAPSAEVGVAAGAPLVKGVLGFRASAWIRHDAGWIDRENPFTHATVDARANRQDEAVLKAALLWQPSEELRVTPTVLYQDRRRHDLSGYWPTADGLDSAKFTSGQFEQIPNPDKYYLVSQKVEWDLPWADLVSNSAYFHRTEQTGYDGTEYDLSYFQSLGWPTSTPNLQFAHPGLYPLLTPAGPRLPASLWGYRSPAKITNLQENVSQELRLSSRQSTEQPIGSPFWTAGIFWELAKQDSREEIHDPGIDSLLSTLFQTTAQSAYGLGLLPGGISYLNYNRAHDRQVALFGEATIPLGNRWKLTLGERLSLTSFDLVHRADGPLNFGGVASSAGQSETASTPRASVLYQIAPKTTTYLSYSRGFRAGAANTPLPSYCGPDLAAIGYPNGAPAKYSSDNTTNYEAGWKTESSRTFTSEIALFYTRWKNIQQSLYVQGSCGLEFTDNLGEAVSKGLDMHAQAALGDSLTLEFSGGYTNARFASDTQKGSGSSAYVLARSGDAIAGQAAVGGGAGSSPPWTIAVGMEYSGQAFRFPVFGRVDFEYAARNPWLTPVQDSRTTGYDPFAFTLPSTRYWSVRGGIQQSQWELSAFVDNLLNSRTTTNYAHSSVDVANPGTPPGPLYTYFTFRPRTIGITFTRRN
jgi:outer membrane receptor protein involved in Fe transport